MRMRRFFLSMLLLAAGCAGAGDLPLSFGDFAANDDIFAAFGAGKREELLSVSLAPESDSIAPGKPFRLILTLTHRGEGYTYFTNPGGVGVGTTVEWDLPAGFTVSEPEWPAPVKYENAGSVFYIHKGNVALVSTVVPPSTLRAGEKIPLRGVVHTQACTPRSCTPMQLPVAADVLVAEAGGSVSPAAKRALDALPQAPGAWRFAAADAAEEIALDMQPPAGMPPETAEAAFRGAYFFDAGATPLVDSQLPQSVEQVEGGWRLRLPRLPGSARAGGNLAGILRVGGESFRLDLPLAPLASPLASVDGATGLASVVPAMDQGSEWALLIFAFLGGLLLNVMPCVFPVIGLKIVGFAKQAHKDRRSVFLHGLMYTGGVLLCFWALAFAVITMGRGWGAQLQSPWFLFALCHIFLIMAMNMAGVFDIASGVAGAGQEGQRKRTGLKRSFFTGLLAVLTSTPCSAPFLGTALAYALALPPLLSLGVFTLMALGFAFPYLALSLFPGWLKKLPKPGPWMDVFRQAMSFPLFGTTAYLFWTMEAMMEEWRFLLLLFGLVLTAMACWLFGKYQKLRSRRVLFARQLAAFAVLALFLGVWLGLPKGEAELAWQDWSPELVQRLRREGVPVYIDFTARWCATCQLNKRVYADGALRELLREKGVALLKADWTLYDERITSTLRTEFDKAAVPVTVLYAPGSARGEVLPDILTAGNVGDALRKLP